MTKETVKTASHGDGNLAVGVATLIYGMTDDLATFSRYHAAVALGVRVATPTHSLFQAHQLDYDYFGPHSAAADSALEEAVKSGLVLRGLEASHADSEAAKLGLPPPIQHSLTQTGEAVARMQWARMASDPSDAKSTRRLAATLVAFSALTLPLQRALGILAAPTLPKPARKAHDEQNLRVSPRRLVPPSPPPDLLARLADAYELDVARGTNTRLTTFKPSRPSNPQRLEVEVSLDPETVRTKYSLFVLKENDIDSVANGLEGKFAEKTLDAKYHRLVESTDELAWRAEAVQMLEQLRKEHPAVNKEVERRRDAAAQLASFTREQPIRLIVDYHEGELNVSLDENWRFFKDRRVQKLDGWLGTRGVHQLLLGPLDFPSYVARCARPGANVTPVRELPPQGRVAAETILGYLRGLSVIDSTAIGAVLDVIRTQAAARGFEWQWREGLEAGLSTPTGRAPSTTHKHPDVSEAALALRPALLSAVESLTTTSSFGTIFARFSEAHALRRSKRGLPQPDTASTRKALAASLLLSYDPKALFPPGRGTESAVAQASGALRDAIEEAFEDRAWRIQYYARLKSRRKREPESLTLAELADDLLRCLDAFYNNREIGLSSDRLH